MSVAVEAHLGPGRILDPELAREVLYVGLSRARDLLVVIGDLDIIGDAGGKELRKRLDKAEANS